MGDLDKVCPTCEAQPPNPCVTKAGKPTSTHQARLLGFAGRRHQLREPRK